ncbi:MAG: ABC transporter permease [Intestinimonas sp.]|jgi:ABC-2 type transport system permease protein|nr:ABC transporter permease [Intestinimonas sp.]
MRSGISCFNKTLYWKNMARYWPIWSLYGVIWLFLLPLNLLLDQSDSYMEASSIPEYFARVTVPRLTAEASIGIMTVFGLLAAMAVFSYLYQSRSAAFYHALPIRRSGLFLTNYLSGLSFLVPPALVVFLLTLGAEAACGYVDLFHLALWLAVQILLALFFYSFAVFCAMFTGNLLALPAFYTILSALPLTMEMLIEYLLQQLLYGFDGLPDVRAAAVWLTPVAKLLDSVRCDHTYSPDQLTVTGSTFYGLQYIMLYALVGLILTGVALAVYRRRQLESAGDVVSVCWVRPVFKYGMGVCTALTLGTFLYDTFFSRLDEGTAMLTICIILCGGVGYFIAAMLLEKSFRVFKNTWKGFVILAVVLAVLVMGTAQDLTGFEQRIPEPEQVASVEVNGLYSRPYDSAQNMSTSSDDPEVIKFVTSLHRAVLDARPLNSSDQRNGNHNVGEDAIMENIQVSYHLKNGGTIRRSYDVVLYREDLDDPDSAASLLTVLINRPELLEETYFPQWIGKEQLMEATMTLHDSQGETEYSFSTQDRNALLEAVRSDLAAGRIGRRYLFDDDQREENCYYNDLRLRYMISEDDANRHGNNTYYMVPQNDSDNYEKANGYISQITITVQTTATDTLAVLDRLGLASQMITQAELDQESE